MKNFQEFIKAKRESARLTLRQFCLQASLDPSNWSKTERGLGEVPKSKEILDRISSVLNLTKEEYNEMMDLAIIASIPKDLITDEKIVEKLPIFFRTVRGEKPNSIELNKLVKSIEKS